MAVLLNNGLLGSSAAVPKLCSHQPSTSSPHQPRHRGSVGLLAALLVEQKHSTTPFDLTDDVSRQKATTRVKTYAAGDPWLPGVARTVQKQ